MTILITADQGSVGLKHSECERSRNYTITVFVWGAVAVHGDLYSFNRDTRDEPGVSRLAYDFTHQPIRNGDTGNLALKLLGLGPIPGSVINANQDLRIASKADFNGDGAVDAANATISRDARRRFKRKRYWSLRRLSRGSRCFSSFGPKPFPVGKQCYPRRVQPT
jgi:hypothetical protein